MTELPGKKPMKIQDPELEGPPQEPEYQLPKNIPAHNKYISLKDNKNGETIAVETFKSIDGVVTECRGCRMWFNRVIKLDGTTGKYFHCVDPFCVQQRNESDQLHRRGKFKGTLGTVMELDAGSQEVPDKDAESQEEESEEGSSACYWTGGTGRFGKGLSQKNPPCHNRRCMNGDCIRTRHDEGSETESD